MISPGLKVRYLLLVEVSEVSQMCVCVNIYTYSSQYRDAGRAKEIKKKKLGQQ